VTEERHPLQDFQGSPFDLDGPPFKPGRAADHQVGVGYYAPWEEPFDGFAEHSRRCARALSETGVPVQLRSIDPGGQLALGEKYSEVARRMEPLLVNSVTQYAVQVYQLVAHAAGIQSIVTHGQRDPEAVRTINRLTALYTVWERQRVSEKIATPLNMAGQVWVACRDNAEMLIRCGVAEDKLRVVPLPFFPDDPLLQLDGRKRSRGVPRFYHIGKWEPRKEQHRILGAFLRAFKPGEARFWLKTSAYAPPMKGYPQSPDDSVHEWVTDPAVRENGWSIERVNKHVRIIREALSAERLRELHRIGDVYVTLSRGEGWDMPAFDAKLAGNLMVYTESGGPQDFAGDGDEAVVPIGTVPAHPMYGWEKEATYLDYYIDDAVDALQAAALSVRRGQRRRGMELGRFSAAAVGKLMRDNLEGMLDGPLASND